MKLVATIKINVRKNQELVDMSNKFRKSLQYVIDKGFENKITNKFKLRSFVYKDLRQWLPANFACEVIMKAFVLLKSVKFKKRPIIKNCPISFNRRLFTFSFNKVRLATFTPRQRMNIPIEIPEYYWKYLDWRYQYLQILMDKKDRMFFHILFSRDVNTPTSCCSDKILGVDIGINNLAVTSDGKVFKGHKTKIMQCEYLRRRLQRKGTKSARRKLKAISGSQKRYMRWVNHNVSKTIVKSADCIVMENLKGIKKMRNKYMGKRLNRWFSSWSIYQLQWFIKYKAEFEGKRIIFTNPYLTSQTCSNCFEIGSRYLNSFVCSHCGFTCDADLNASYNLRRLSVTQPNVSCNDAEAYLYGLRQSIGTKIPNH